MNCYKCKNICQKGFLEFKKINSEGTKIQLTNRLCLDCLKEFLLEKFIEDLHAGHLDEHLKEHYQKFKENYK